MRVAYAFPLLGTTTRWGTVKESKAGAPVSALAGPGQMPEKQTRPAMIAKCLEVWRETSPKATGPPRGRRVIPSRAKGWTQSGVAPPLGGGGTSMEAPRAKSCHQSRLP